MTRSCASFQAPPRRRSLLKPLPLQQRHCASVKEAVSRPGRRCQPSEEAPLLKAAPGMTPPQVPSDAASRRNDGRMGCPPAPPWLCWAGAPRGALPVLQPAILSPPHLRPLPRPLLPPRGPTRHPRRDLQLSCGARASSRLGSHPHPDLCSPPMWTAYLTQG
ncbi:hypothetical protein T484DRAFT_1938996 [Baffinella frigidus]|nr:hypothetical protein T484DRAFT_1938996 [Cryptophyta sp. CCMP2293]